MLTKNVPDWQDVCLKVWAPLIGLNGADIDYGSQLKCEAASAAVMAVEMKWHLNLNDNFQDIQSASARVCEQNPLTRHADERRRLMWIEMAFFFLPASSLLYSHTQRHTKLLPLLSAVNMERTSGRASFCSLDSCKRELWIAPPAEVVELYL